jgi:hypothetical protein
MSDGLTCLRCGNEMTLGVVWDRNSGSGFHWESGFHWTERGAEPIPIHKLFSLNVEQIPVKAFRCQRCGYVELSAPSKNQEG